MVRRYDPPRVYVAATTVEVVFNLTRLHNATYNDGMEFKMVMRRKGETNETTWTSYGMDKSGIHFMIPPKFMNDSETYPKGFYDGALMYDECTVSEFELVKAPGMYVRSAKAIDDDCTDTGWVEPVMCTCDPNCKCYETGHGCNCGCNVHDGCSTCVEDYRVVAANIKDGYVDYDNY